MSLKERSHLMSYKQNDELRKIFRQIKILAIKMHWRKLIKIKIWFRNRRCLDLKIWVNFI